MAISRTPSTSTLTTTGMGAPARSTIPACLYWKGVVLGTEQRGRDKHAVLRDPQWLGAGVYQMLELGKVILSYRSLIRRFLWMGLGRSTLDETG